MRRAAAGSPVCVTVTDLSGIIIARPACGHPGPRIGAAMTLRCPQRSGPAGHDRVKEPASRQ
jgi:hypothetical protein